ncbi:MAG: TRAP transporter substrate-binding protein DctP, partial [Clostridia bacterium]|nr:TRAP transporter substrate-binding protein DctP [Clostridia bacterium]
FDEDKELNAKVLREGNATKELNRMLEEKNVKALDWILEDFSCWTSNKPIRTLEDFQGLKIRVMESPMDIEGVRVLGANPTPISFAEVYSALQLNMVDGQQNPIVIINSNKFYEVQKYLTLSNHTVVVDIVASNPDFWDSLSHEDQEKLNKVFLKVNALIIEQQGVQTAEALEEIKAAGTTEIIELSAEEKEKFIEASAKAEDKFIELAGENGKKILDLFIQDMENFR